MKEHWRAKHGRSRGEEEVISVKNDADCQISGCTFSGDYVVVRRPRRDTQLPQGAHNSGLVDLPGETLQQDSGPANAYVKQMFRPGALTTDSTVQAETDSVDRRVSEVFDAAQIAEAMLSGSATPQDFQQQYPPLPPPAGFQSARRTSSTPITPARTSQYVGQEQQEVDHDSASENASDFESGTNSSSSAVSDGAESSNGANSESAFQTQSAPTTADVSRSSRKSQDTARSGAYAPSVQAVSYTHLTLPTKRIV